MELVGFQSRSPSAKPAAATFEYQLLGFAVCSTQIWQVSCLLRCLEAM